MTKTSKNGAIRVRIDEGTKVQAEVILNNLGLTPQKAIELFYKQVIMQRCLPFQLKLPEIHLSPLNPRSQLGPHIHRW